MAAKTATKKAAPKTTAKKASGNAATTTRRPSPVDAVVTGADAVPPVTAPAVKPALPEVMCRKDGCKINGGVVDRSGRPGRPAQWHEECRS